jgi:cell division protein FtsB
MADQQLGAANADWEYISRLLATLENLVTTSMQALADENAQLRAELAQLRAENTELRRRLDGQEQTKGS